MPVNIAERIVKARATGYYEPLREQIEDYASQGYSQRYIAAQMKISRQTIIIASRALNIEFTRRKDVPIGQHKRRMREFLLKTSAPDLPTQTPRSAPRELTLIEIIRVYTAQWDRGW